MDPHSLDIGICIILKIDNLVTLSGATTILIDSHYYYLNIYFDHPKKT